MTQTTQDPSPLDVRRPVPAEPPGFEEFWTRLARSARDVAPEVEQRSGVPVGSGRAQEVRFTSLGGVRLGGWLLRPPGEVTSAVLVSHGYGGRAEPDPAWARDGVAAFFPVARGLPTVSLVDGIGATGAEHVLHGIDDVTTYVHGGCAADVWVAVTAFEELLGVPLGSGRGGLRLTYVGASFGGGIGALALPWDDRFDAGVLHVPSFGDHDARLATPCTGSGEAVRLYAARHPEVRDVLRFFDAATSAARIGVPTLVAPAHVDPAVPPVGQWAVARAVPQEHRRVLPMTAGHLEYPEEESERATLLAAALELARQP